MRSSVPREREIGRQDVPWLPRAGRNGLEPHWFLLLLDSVKLWLSSSFTRSRVWQILHMIGGRWR